MKQINISSLMSDSGVGFGTSGARGLVSRMTDEVCYAYTCAFLQHLRQQKISDNNLQVAIAGDLRSSTHRIMVAVIKAAEAMKVEPVFCGLIPSPAVALYGIEHQMPSIMVTGSHIPDDRNGIKFNTALGEITKDDEQGIREQSVSLDEALFDSQGRFVQQYQLPAVNNLAASEYHQRYTNIFGQAALEDMAVGVYQHSGVARDLLVILLQELGAKVIALGRSETFVPVDTEAIRDEDVELARQWVSEHHLDAIVSTDGDADRPLISDEKGSWLRGDAVGSLCARFLGADYIVTPVSSNTAVDKSGWFSGVSRTRIGSPFVIKGMENLAQAGNKKIVGYEANGGFLQQDGIDLDGHILSPLPTRDAVIVILGLLVSAKQQGISISRLATQLPQRYTFSDRIKNIPTDKSKALIAGLETGSPEQDKNRIREFFGQKFGEVESIDITDGLRITFSNKDIVHLRPSGNAPELRCYTESGNLANAREINREVLQIVKQALS
ncbi:MAG: phosphomannomutase [Gammaproteobacteria bacterium]|nr:phosphomannomutase [Gammaproteobacteria bacterium]